MYYIRNNTKMMHAIYFPIVHAELSCRSLPSLFSTCQVISVCGRLYISLFKKKTITRGQFAHLIFKQFIRFIASCSSERKKHHKSSKLVPRSDSCNYYPICFLWHNKSNMLFHNITSEKNARLGEECSYGWRMLVSCILNKQNINSVSKKFCHPSSNQPVLFDIKQVLLASLLYVSFEK